MVRFGVVRFGNGPIWLWSDLVMGWNVM